MMCDANLLVKSIKKVKEDTEDSLVSKNIKLIFPTSEELNRILSKKIGESIVKFLENGIFTLNKIVSEELFSKIMYAIQNPEEEKINELKETMEKEYERRLRKKIKEIIIQEIKAKIAPENISKVDIVNSVRQFFILPADKDIDEIIENLKGEKQNGRNY